MCFHSSAPQHSWKQCKKAQRELRVSLPPTVTLSDWFLAFYNPDVSIPYSKSKLCSCVFIASALDQAWDTAK